MQKYCVTFVIRVTFAAALLIGLADRASAGPITLSDVQVQLDIANLTASITAGLTVDTEDGADVFLDGLGVSLSRNGIPLDLFAGPTLLDDLPFFSLPLSLSDGASLPSMTLLFRLTGLALNSSYSGSFELFQFGVDGPEPLLTVPQDFSFATPVPEPGTLWLLAAGASALACRRRRKT